MEKKVLNNVFYFPLLSSAGVTTVKSHEKAGIYFTPDAFMMLSGLKPAASGALTTEPQPW